jgi:FO synthase
VRRVICPDKIDTEQWLTVHDAAHRVGLSSNVTMMFGHVDGPQHWARHMVRAREQQRRSGGFTEFVPLPFVHMEAPLWRRGLARSGPTFGETILVHAVARLVLHPWITNVQASWVKLGLAGAAEALRAGCNDLGGTLMNESISRAAGAAHGQELTPERMDEAIRAAGRVPRLRTTFYDDAPVDRQAASCMTFEWRRRRGLPMRATRRVMQALRSARRGWCVRLRGGRRRARRRSAAAGRAWCRDRSRPDD